MGIRARSVGTSECGRLWDGLGTDFHAVDRRYRRYNLLLATQSRVCVRKRVFDRHVLEQVGIMDCVDNVFHPRSRVSARWASRDEMVKSGVGHIIKDGRKNLDVAKSWAGRCCLCSREIHPVIQSMYTPSLFSNPPSVFIWHGVLLRQDEEHLPLARRPLRARIIFPCESYVGCCPTGVTPSPDPVGARRAGVFWEC